MTDHAISPDAVEAECLRIYERILDVPDLQPTDEFIRVGGDSMKAVLIATELENTFGVELPMATFYEHKNVAEIANWLRGAR
ncbi:MAG: acyl carrier protein [Candidatus Eremiobacteraeota bacterium]|jgi:acyl carrier protein|nr:acyl carrier protein [Candidatus Eremiobacteraeota bacterium]